MDLCLPLVFQEIDKFLELLARAACAQRFCLHFDLQGVGIKLISISLLKSAEIEFIASANSLYFSTLEICPVHSCVVHQQE